MNTVVDPNNPDKNISGTIKLIDSNLTSLMKFISSTKAANNKKQAKLEDPIEYPFVLAFVTLPTASNKSVI